MKKVFGIAAMLLALAACNKIETNVQPVENNEGIPFSATISVGNNATTKALAESGSTIVATWAVDETVALIHNGVKDEMTVSAVNEGVATITGTITGSPSDGDAVTVIYPASAADGFGRRRHHGQNKGQPPLRTKRTAYGRRQYRREV